MLLMNGVLTCREYFTSNVKIQILSRQLFDRVEWNWLVDRSLGKNANRFFSRLEAGADENRDVFRPRGWPDG